jgi:hypothetical protein
VTLDVFLSAFDPSDLPGGSIDPLGFDRGYSFLADKILPGLTNVAASPRYFSMLCAGILLAEVDDSESPRKAREQRRGTVLRFERLWAMASVLTTRESGAENLGVRGITYVNAEIERLERNGLQSTDADYQLLSRQAPYGVLGIYGAVAEGMRLIDSATYGLTPDSGQTLAKAFLDETATPAVVRRAAKSGDVSVRALREWGQRAWIGGHPKEAEGACLSDVFHRNPVRSRMAKLLRRAKGKGASEIERLSAAAESIQDGSKDVDLRDALRALLHFEKCYQLALLGFERLLWLARTVPGGIVTTSQQAADPVLQRISEQLPKVVRKFVASLDNTCTNYLAADSDRLADVREFLSRAAVVSSEPVAMTEVLVTRHRDVQHGKFDRGRRKMPWIEPSGGSLSLTSNRVGGLAFEVTDTEGIRPHAYRLAAADAFLAASGSS